MRFRAQVKQLNAEGAPQTASAGYPADPNSAEGVIEAGGSSG